MTSLIKKLEVAQKTNDIVTPESSDVDSTESDIPITPGSVENEKIIHNETLEIIIEDKNDETTIIDISNNSS